MADTDTPAKTPPRAQRDTSMYQLLSEQLADCKTTVEMLALVQTDEWQRASRSLDDSDLEALRAQYRSRKESLDGKSKLEPFNGQILTVFQAQTWYSDTYDNEGVTIHFTSESPPIKTPESDALGAWHPEKEYTALTSAPAVVRFCTSFRDMPSREHPIRGRFHMEPVSDPTRARAGQKLWKVDRLAERRQMDIPF